MSQSEKMQMFDLPMALVMLVAGVTFIALRKKMAERRAEIVKKGGLSEDEAKKNDRLTRFGSYFITGVGIFLLAMWFAGY